MSTKKTDKTKVNTKPLRVFEAFAGIGAQRKALANINKKYEVVGMAEWFITAIISYQAIHHHLTIDPIDHKTTTKTMIKYLESLPLSLDSKQPIKKGYWKRKKLNELRIIYKAVKASEAEGNIFDVRTLYKRKLADVDLITYSFPCQDLSQQGKQRGIKEGTRSGLLWEVEKALESTPKTKLPKYLLMENVTALIHKTFKDDLSKWMKRLEKLGYKNNIKILNAGDFGSAQARRRVYMISSLKKEVKLPEGKQLPKAIKTVLDKKPSNKDFMPSLDKYDISDFRLTKSNINKGTLINYSTFNSEAYVYDLKHTGPTLTASGANSRIKMKYDNKIRKMNAREAYQYMGFDEEDYNKVNALNFLTQTKMIYTCGNSISVEVLEEIMRGFE
ncbi:DNA (cytosine-5-)-methyltransferase [Candidatus Mycoplasma mahonii]|uniref:DNA (cytosine-5-)-methyltransferase n=1 Tax=Candidatus Mycoplasma mahonii TaxID=3004105 RepID=UPI0026F2F8A5|nr:DNA (cytosine-5-)-methyltransferase [Candidatus Mycoplasma mahonii]WKX02760.1 DNA (cytosine-5-)-methyltransferase [Candidatus Mycoplasma mahonii]